MEGYFSAGVLVFRLSGFVTWHANTMVLLQH